MARSAFSIWAAFVFASLFVVNVQALRVVSLSPNLTELVCHLGACKELVAVGSSSNYPKQVQKLPHIGGYQAINLEELLSLQPNLVLAWQTPLQSAVQNSLFYLVVWRNLAT